MSMKSTCFLTSYSLQNIHPKDDATLLLLRSFGVKQRFFAACFLKVPYFSRVSIVSLN